MICLLKSRLSAVLFLLFVAVAVSAQRKPAAQPILPAAFAGWTQSATETSKDPAKADPANAALLKEFGFVEEERAEYRRDDRVIKVSAVRFTDAGGALGAFEFYREPDAIKEDVGDQAASLAHLTILFRRSNLLVQVKLDKLTAMTAEQLRELSATLPKAQGEAGNLPQVPSFLPKRGQVSNSGR